MAHCVKRKRVDGAEPPASGGAGTSDHTQLSNLQGDGGHTDVFLADGSKPMSGTLNMNNQTLANGLWVIGQNIIGTTEVETPSVRSYNNGPLSLNAPGIVLREFGGVPYMILDPTEAKAFTRLNMDKNGITEIDSVKGPNASSSIRFNTGVSGADVQVTCNDLDVQTSSVVGSKGSVSLNATETVGPLTVFEGIKLSASPTMGVKLNSDAQVILEGGNSSATLNSTFFYLKRQSDGLAVLDVQVGTPDANIALPVQKNVPSGAFMVPNGGAYVRKDLQVDGKIYCDTINNIRPSGGVYSESSGFTVLSSNLNETNLLGQGTSAGSLSVPAGDFLQLDTFAFKASGRLTGGSNDTFTLRLKSNVSGVGSVEFGAIPVQISDNGLVDVWWDIVADFTVRSLGSAGSATLVLSGSFRYTNNNDVVKTFGRTIIDSTNFDTTKDNTLQLTYENDPVNPLTSFTIDSCSFTKWF